MQILCFQRSYSSSNDVYLCCIDSNKSWLYLERTTEWWSRLISLQKYLKNYVKFDSFYLNKSIRFFFQAYSLYDSNFSSSTEYKPGRNLNNKKNHLSFSTSHFLQLCYSPGFIINSYNFLKTHTNKHIQSNLLLTANSSQRPLFYNGNLFWRTDHTSTVSFF